MSVGSVQSSENLAKAAKEYRKAHPWVNLGKNLGEVIALDF